MLHNRLHDVAVLCFFHVSFAGVCVLTAVAHSLGHVVNIYIFSISDVSILSCLFPKLMINNG